MTKYWFYAKKISLYIQGNFVYYLTFAESLKEKSWLRNKRALLSLPVKKRGPYIMNLSKVAANDGLRLFLN